ncbi:MAG: TIR domain-containing protein [Methanosarcinaceae archaeon]
MSWKPDGWEPEYAHTWHYEDAICPYCGHSHSGDMRFETKYDNSTRVYLKGAWGDFQYDGKSSTQLIIPTGSCICDACNEHFSWTETVKGKFHSIRNGEGTWLNENKKHYAFYLSVRAEDIKDEQVQPDNYMDISAKPDKQAIHRIFGNYYFVGVDYDNFRHVLEVATKREFRLRTKDKKVDSFIQTENINMEPVGKFIQQMRDFSPKVTFITKGLMKGLYVYFLQEKTAFKYVNTNSPINPLPNWKKGTYAYDVLLSYSRNDLLKARKIDEELCNRGLRSQMIDVEHDPSDPIWSVRYRELMFYSHYMIPFFTKNYLGSHGTAVEMFAMVQMRIEEWRSVFFSFIIPIIEKSEQLISDVFSTAKMIDLQKYDKHSFSWLKNNIFVISLEKGIVWVADLLESLTKNSNKEYNLEFLWLLKEEVKYIAFSSTNDLRIVKIFLKSPHRNTFQVIDILSDGRCVDRGIGDASGDVIRVGDIRDFMSEIQKYLGDTFVMFRT